LPLEFVLLFQFSSPTLSFLVFWVRLAPFELLEHVHHDFVCAFINHLTTRNALGACSNLPKALGSTFQATFVASSRLTSNTKAQSCRVIGRLAILRMSHFRSGFTLIPFQGPRYQLRSTHTIATSDVGRVSASNQPEGHYSTTSCQYKTAG
jgi:hypothetical protein